PRIKLRSVPRQPPRRGKSADRRRRSAADSESAAPTTLRLLPRVAAAGELHDLRDVQRLAADALLDLRLAREPVGDDERLAVRLAHLREERALAARLRDLVVAGLVAPRSRHAAAAAVEDLDLDPHRLEQLLLRLDPARRLVVAVAVQERAAPERRQLDPFPLEKLGEVHR